MEQSYSFFIIFDLSSGMRDGDILAGIQYLLANK